MKTTSTLHEACRYETEAAALKAADSWQQNTGTHPPEPYYAAGARAWVLQTSAGQLIAVEPPPPPPPPKPRPKFKRPEPRPATTADIQKLLSAMKRKQNRV